MANEQLVSIVIPAYEPRIDWLREAVVSALNERDCEVEVIVVDDGSSDPVAHLITDIEDPRLRVLRVEHGGAAHARNAGIRIAQGAYFRFSDADDVIEPGSTARLLRLARAHGCIAYGTTLVCDAELHPAGVKGSTLEGWIAEECLLRQFHARHFAMLFPRDVVDAVGGWETTMPQCQDWDFVLRALERAPARAVGEVVASYRRHGGSLGSNVDRALQNESRVVDRYFERHPELAGTKLERRARRALLIARARAEYHRAGIRRDGGVGPLVRALTQVLWRTPPRFASSGRLLRRRREETD
jgi:glycosyltransferase involved in cell wall biosynthesis